jgi:VanZ family protein
MEAIKRWLPLLVWGALIFVGSSIPQLTNEKFGMPPGTDKVVHVVEYLVLAVLFCRGFGVRRLGESVSVWLLVIAICLAVGAVDEYHQRYIPGRDSNVLDFAADTLGIAVGTSLGAWWLKRGGARRAEKV